MLKAGMSLDEQRLTFVSSENIRWMRHKESDAVAALYEAGGKPHAAAWCGKRNNNYTKKARMLEVGDVLRCSWGYDQTNIDYYQVTKLVGKTMVEIRQIAGHSVDTAWMQGESAPQVGAFIGKPMRRKAIGDGVRVNSFSSALKMKPVAEVGNAKMYESSHWTAYH